MITLTDFNNSIPLVLIAAASLLILIIETVFPKEHRGKAEAVIFYFSVLLLLSASYFAFRDVFKNIIIYSNFIRISPLTSSLNLIILLGTLLTVISSKEYLEQESINYGEYYSLVLLSALGMMLMAAANDLIILFIGLELMSVCFYILAGFIRRKPESNESALKYFLLGAFLTGFLLLGIAFIYGYTGTTNYSAITSVSVFKGQFYFLGIVLVFIAFLFKTGSFPLQMWIPDVYQGSPTIVAGMMSSVGKTAAFGAMLSFFSAFNIRGLTVLVAIVSILTMLYGNVLALMQSNIKRLLAYSSIAHAGYILIGFIVLSPSATQAVMFYLLTYVLMQLGSFIAIGIIEELPDVKKYGTPTSLESYKGLGKTNPGIASLMSIFLFSLAGIPPFAGFWGKYFIFYSAIQGGFVWVAVTGILLSLVGVYYYIKVVLYMWFYEPSEVIAKERGGSDFAFTAAVISTAGLFIFGFYPGIILNLIRLVS